MNQIEIKMTKQEAISLWKKIQSNACPRYTMFEEFPDKHKGSIAKGLFKRTNEEFLYGIEYGMLILLHKIFDITDEDLE